MIEEPPILTIKKNRLRPSENQITAFKDTPTSIVTDALMGAGVMSANINHIDGGKNLPSTAFGPALTADCGPADILAIMASLNFAQSGDIIVGAFGGHQGCAVLGDRIIGMMKNIDIAGFVTDGPMRDFDGIVNCGLPVWCTGLNPASPYSNGPGTVGFPIQIGGQQVSTGDMIVADRDGVVVVPFSKLDEVVERINFVRNLEEDLDVKVALGQKHSPKIQKLLQSDKVKFVD